MRTNSRRGGWGLVLGLIALFASAPERASAQQTGLFPLSPIKRQRVPCDQQDPIYKDIKYKYYGYHPTCWRPFPTGWGCPSPERPDKEKSFRELKLKPGTPFGQEPGEPGPGGMEGGPAPTRPAAPTLPEFQSPFDQPATPNRPGNAPGAAPAGGRPGASPFELDKPDTPPAAAPNAPRAGRSRRPAPLDGEDAPELSAPAAEQPDRIVGSRSSRADWDDESDARPEGGPLLAVPNVNLPPVTDSTLVFGTEPPPAAAPPAETPIEPAAAPGATAPRRGILSGLFNNLGWNWTRR